MSASQEEDCLGLEFDTESDSVSEAEEEESSAGSKTAGKTVRRGGSTGHQELSLIHISEPTRPY